MNPRGELDHALSTANLYRRLQAIKRHNRAINNELEDDAGHSYSLALLALSLIEKYHLPLSKEKCLCYAIVHDLLEVETGDAVSNDKKGQAEKRKHEAEALEKLRNLDPGTCAILEEYEKQDSDEARFIYGLDKIQSILMNLHEDGQSWKENGYTYDFVITYKAAEISQSPHLARLWQQIIADLTENRRKYFSEG